MSRRLFLNVIGDPGAGKTTAATHLEHEWGFSIFRPSDVIRAHAAKIGKRLTCRSDYLVVHQRILEHDPNSMINAALNTEGDRVVLDGMRVPSHLDTIKKQLGQISCLRTIALDCPPAVRYHRIQQSRSDRVGRDESTLGTYEEFLADSEADNQGEGPNGANVQDVMANADITIDTYRPLPWVLGDIDRFVAHQIISLENNHEM